MDRRSFLLGAAAIPALFGVLTACGDSTKDPGGAPASTPGTAAAGGSIPYPTGADDVVVRVAQVGGFVPAGTAFVEVPDLLITGDGRVYRPGAQTMQFPGPLLPAITVGTITPTGIERLLEVAHQNQLLSLPAPTYAPNTQVADAPSTVVDLQAAGVRVQHTADALGFVPDGQGDPAKELTPERGRLLTFANAARDLSTTVGADQLGPDEIWAPTAYRLQARPVEAPPATTPADTVAAGDPQPTVVDWPAGTGVRLADAATCAIGSGEALATALKEATSLTYFAEDGVVYQVSAIGQLPGTSC